MASPTPIDEASRLRTLRALNILDTPRERRYDRFVAIATRLFNAPIAVVSFIDGDRQWFKAAAGLDARQFPRGVSLCAYTIMQDGAHVVEDTADHPEFAQNPSVTGPLGIRFYAGCAIEAEDGSHVGTLAIMDTQPRSFSQADRVMLEDLADLVSREVFSLGATALDRITGLPTRRGFESVAQQVLAISRRHDHSASLLLLDMENLSDFAQQRGLEEADELLAETGELLGFAFRQSDVIAHLGNGKFCILLTGAGVDQAELCLERLRTELRGRNAVAGARHRISYRLGFAEFRDPEHRSLEDLIGEAERTATPTDFAEQVALA
ncbi:MAG: diguanylate cyclase [Pseudomonadota bacterium]